MVPMCLLQLVAVNSQGSNRQGPASQPDTMRLHDPKGKGPEKVKDAGPERTSRCLLSWDQRPEAHWSLPSLQGAPPPSASRPSWAGSVNPTPLPLFAKISSEAFRSPRSWAAHPPRVPRRAPERGWELELRGGMGRRGRSLQSTS